MMLKGLAKPGIVIELRIDYGTSGILWMEDILHYLIDFIVGNCRKFRLV